MYEYLNLDPDPGPDLDLGSELSLIKTESEDLERYTYAFITKGLTQDDFTESVLDKIDFEQVLQKNEFLDSIAEVLQKNELTDHLTHLPEDDLPLSDLKEESDNCNFDFLESDFDDLNTVNYTDQNDDSKKLKLKSKITKLHKIKPRAKSKVKEKISVVKYEEVDDISLADLIQESGVNDKLVKARQKFLKNKAKLKDRILEILDSGQFDDLGDNVKMTKEIFIKIFNRYDKCDVRMLTLKPGIKIGNLKSIIKKIVFQTILTVHSKYM